METAEAVRPEVKTKRAEASFKIEAPVSVILSIVVAAVATVIICR